MKVVVTGGHHNSALVIAEQLIKRGNRIFWFGHKYSIIGDKQVSAEYREVTHKQIPFYSIVAGKLQLKHQPVLHLLRIPLGFIQSLYLFIKIQPNAVYSSGGYLALPVCTIAWLFRVPVFTHEQAVVTGIANRIISRIAKRIYTAFPVKYPYPDSKTVFVGLPVRQGLVDCRKKLFNNTKKTLYIVGGKQGSHHLNETVFASLTDLLAKYNLIQACGSNTIYNDYHRANVLRSQLGSVGENYIVKEYFNESEIGAVFSTADLVVSRAGAHTVYELLLLNKPALLVPIPWSHNNEQGKNAEFLVSCNLGEVIEDKKLNRRVLITKVINMFANLSRYQRNDCFIPPKDTTKRIINDMREYVKI